MTSLKYQIRNFLRGPLYVFLTIALVFSACNKQEIIPVEPDQPGIETEMDANYRPFANSYGQIAPYVYEMFDQELVEMMALFIPENYVFDLLQAVDYTYDQGNPAVVFLGLEPVVDFTSTEYPIIQFNNVAAERLTREYAPFPSDGFYQVKNLLMVDTDGDQNLYDLGTTNAEAVKKASKEGGICATLAIAHSLVHRNNIIPEDGRGEWPETSETEDGKKYWNPDFLKKIYDASGDSDGNRGLTDDEMEEAHTGDWSSDWDVDKSKDMTTIEEPGDKPSASELSEWCKEMKKFVDERKDDCILRTRGTMTYKDIDGNTQTKRVGHAMTITSVEEKDGKCKVTVVNTARQDPNQDWENVPYDPGDQEWEIGTNGTKISRNNGWGTSIVWDEIAFFCFDEDPKRDDVKGSDYGTPGSALE